MIPSTLFALEAHRLSCEAIQDNRVQWPIGEIGRLKRG